MFLAINQNALSSKKRKKHEGSFENVLIGNRAADLEPEPKPESELVLEAAPELGPAQPAPAPEPEAAVEAIQTGTTSPLMASLRAAAAAAAADSNVQLGSAAAPASTFATKCKNGQKHTSHNDRHLGRHQGPTAAQQQQQQQQQSLLPAGCVSPQCQGHAPEQQGQGLGWCPCQWQRVNKNDPNCGQERQRTPKKKSPAPPITSLCTVYLCLGALAFAMGTMAMLFYTHVSSTSSSTLSGETNGAAASASARTYATESNLVFREQFRRELLASDHVVRSMVAEVMREQVHQQQQQLQQHQRPHEYGHQSRSPRTMSDGTSAATNNDAPADDVVDADDDDDDDDAVRDKGVGAIVRNERKYTASATGSTDAAQRVRRDISSSPSSMHADPFIEFFSPNHRKVLEEQDVEIRKRTGQKGAAPGGDEWIYLNTYCRVPEKMITGFCKSTQDYCPPSPQGPPGLIGPKGTTGPPGLPGIPGPKGNRGDVGLPGPTGIDGAVGPPGGRGPKGDIGIPGRAGLDGRDGVPGEPGLDGVPGRAGADGIPGKDGMPGRDGRDGLNGKDGKDGATGPKGAQGPPGERGLKGIAGPRGRSGKSGTNGTPGIPGINVWKVALQNGSFSNDLLIPPSIADLNAPHIQRTVIVEEGRTLNLSCAASGNPLPHVEWRRDDGRTINILGVEMSSVSGPFLKFSNITRNQMAAYTCFADNGIAPVANATFLVEVHFSPMIAVYRQMIYAEYGQSASLECLVEAFPEAIRYWERAYDGKILDPGEKYRIETYPDGFKTTMRLTISNLRKDDFGYYHCVARNELNATMVDFEIAPQDPNSETPYVGKEVRVYGKRPPESECPICEHCPDPSLYQCKDAINSVFEIQATGNYSYPGLPKRQKSCLLYAVGKPVFHKSVNENYGCWLKDAAAKEVDREKTFVTDENDAHNLLEFTTKIQYRMHSVPYRKYDIPEGFEGNAHVVYNGSFYYNQKNSDLVVKLDLTTLKKTATQLPYAGIATGNKLYSTFYNYMDFNVDEVGLWVIYSTYNSNNTLVAKLDAENLKMQYNFNITLDHRQFGEMFIVCGHLYAIDSCTEKNSHIRYAVDLYKGKLVNVDLPYSNPFGRTTTVGYNPLTVELYSLDRGNALTYPIRYKEKTLGTDQP